MLLLVLLWRGLRVMRDRHIACIILHNVIIKLYPYYHVLIYTDN